MAELKEIADSSSGNLQQAIDLLRSGKSQLTLNELALLVNTVLSVDGPTIIPEVLKVSTDLRQKLFGNWLIPMAPVEVSNTCASDCLFCGWRVSNRAMKRLKLTSDLAMHQVEYLVDSGIAYIEFVSGDDISVVRDLLPDLIQRTRSLFDERGINGKISFCTLALTEKHYHELKSIGADNMIVWQETYDHDIFHQYVKGGPKAYGITDDWKLNRSGDGCDFRIQSQEKAMRAGLEVGLGAMLGLNPDVTSEFLATVDHARYLIQNYGATPDRPIIIGMPIWNKITTRETDLRPAELIDMNQLFPALASLYLLALPDEGTWVFPNCRVPLPVQIKAAAAAGAFSSTEVKLGPGGYYPEIILRLCAQGQDTSELEHQVSALLKQTPGNVKELAELLDQSEQFVHHYHSHDRYRTAMEQAGLQLTHEPRISH